LQKLGVNNKSIPIFNELREIYETTSIPRMKSGEENIVWVAIDEEINAVVAELMVKYEVDETGGIEIGYGTYPEFLRKGYMTEMVAHFIDWARVQPRIKRITAETDKANNPSIKVLVKNNFQKFHETDEFYWWEINLK
jgi:RimJ/RimL family protein N-acetyltransferase